MMKSSHVGAALFCMILFALLTGLSACRIEKEPIRIGAAGTMTGVNSDLSVSGRRGVELAVEEFNANGGLNGRKVELVVKDDKNDSETALKIDNEFIDESIPVVIGHYTSGMIVSAMDALKSEDILFLSPTISADALSGKDDNFIRFIATTKAQADILAIEACKNKHYRLAVVYDMGNKGFCEVLYENFKHELELRHGQIILTETFVKDTAADFSHLAESIVTSKADAVLIIADSANNAKIAQQIRKMGSTIQIYAPLWSNTADLPRKGGTAVDGMLIVGAIDLNDPSPAFAGFREKYFNKYGENPTFSAMFSYEAAQALFKAMKMGPDLKPATIKQNILKIKDFEGLQGDYQIDAFGDNTRQYMIFRLVNGELRKVE